MMAIFCAFREFKFELLDNISSGPQFMRDINLAATCLNPLQSYVDSLNIRLLSMLVNGENPEDRDSFPLNNTEKPPTFIKNINHMLPRAATAIKLIKDISDYQQYINSSYKIQGFVLCVDKSKMQIFFEKENVVRTLYFDKLTKVTEGRDKCFTIVKPDRKKNKKKPNGEDDRNRKNQYELKVHDDFEFKILSVKDELPELQFDFP